jgi:hypothetical protein
MADVLVKIFQNYPDIYHLTKELNDCIAYGDRIFKNDTFLCSLIWVYKFYLNKEIMVYLPDQIDFSTKIQQFNNEVSNFQLTEENITIMNTDINSFDKSSTFNGVVIYGYAEFLFNEHVNKKRLCTQIKNSLKRNKIIVLSCSSLKPLNFEPLDTFTFYSFNKETINIYNLLDNISFIDIYDKDDDIFDSNVESLVDIIESFKSKKIYLSLDLPISKIKEIEASIKERDIDIYRKECNASGVVINASKTTSKQFLKERYDIYILKIPKVEHYGLFPYIKDVFGDMCEIYIDSYCMNNIRDACSYITNEKLKKTIIKESQELENYSKINDPILISEKYYTLTPSAAIKELNLNNLSKKDYDTIRYYVKLKLNLKNFDINSCQLTTPSNPKYRSKKLNSFANKLSSKSYRCDVTCEIFDDYNIGVVVWSDITYPVDAGNYVYQTTTGKWKCTSIIESF